MVSALGSSLEKLRATRENPAYLAGVALPGFTVTDELETALSGGVAGGRGRPLDALRDVMGRAGRWLAPGALIANATKGIEMNH